MEDKTAVNVHSNCRIKLFQGTLLYDSMQLVLYNTSEGEHDDGDRL